MPVPSAKAMHSTNNPMSTVRRSVHATSGLVRGVEPSSSWRSSGRKPRALAGTSTATSTAIASRWATGATPIQFIAAPVSAPATVPTLKAAWNRDMIDRSSFCSTAAACTFIDTSHALAPNPKRNSPTPTITTSTFVPMATTTTPLIDTSDIAVTVRVVPNRCTSSPEEGSESSDPIAVINSSRPSGRGFKWSRSRICGTRERTDAMATPARANTR